MYLKNMSSFMKENIKDSNEKYLISDYYIQREVLRDIINKIIPNQDNLDKYAISLIEKSVNQNYKDSQIILINLYDNFNFSNGRYYDMTKAVNLYEILAKQGDMEYQSILSREYIKGEHVKQDFEKAFEWAEKSANQGSISGQYNLGVLYFNGKGVEQDYKKAIELFEKSANQGSTVSQNTLGEIYIEGKGVEVNKYKAYQYWNMAKDNSFKAKENIEKLCSDPFNSEICKN
jgi:TPR repeat protein